MKAIRHENKIESFGKPAAQLTDAGGSPAEAAIIKNRPISSTPFLHSALALALLSKKTNPLC